MAPPATKCSDKPIRYTHGGSHYFTGRTLRDFVSDFTKSIKVCFILPHVGSAVSSQITSVPKVHNVLLQIYGSPFNAPHHSK